VHDRVLNGVSVTYPGLVPFSPDASSWNCYEWKDYYIALKNTYGKAQAVSLFTIDFNSLSMFSYAFNWCKYDCDIYNYFKAEGVDIGWSVSHLWCSAESLSEGVEGFTQALAKAGGLIGVGLVGFGGWWLYKNFIK